MQESLFGRSLPWSGEFVDDAGVLRDAIDGTCGILHCERNRGVVLETLAEVRGNWAKVEFRRCVEGALARLDQAVTASFSKLSGAVVVVVNDPLNPLNEAEICDVAVGQSVHDALSGHDLSQNWICLNGLPLLRRNPETGDNEWETTTIKDGDLIWVLPLLPEGGDDGSALVDSIVALVVSVAAPYLAPMILGKGASAFALKAMSAAITVGANYIVGLFVPTPSQPAPLADPEPTYSFSQVRNQLRPGATIPRVYGSMKRMPDLLSRPWSEFENNEQLLHLLLCVSLGDQDITEFGIADTKVWSKEDGFSGAVEDVEFEVIKPGGSVSLFPADVEVNTEVDGLELPPPDAEDGVVVFGPYTAVQTGQQATRLVLDFVFPRGLFSTDGDAGGAPSGNVFEGDSEDGIDSAWVTWKVQARLIDDQGIPIGFWQDLEEVTFAASALKAQRITRGFDVDAGRYEVKVSRLSDLVATGSGQEQLIWYGLKAYILSETVLPDVTALALRVRASAASSAASQEWYVRATSILPHFDAETQELVTGPTEQVDAAALDIIRGQHGLEFEDSRIDLPSLKALAKVWQTQGDVCCTAVEDEMGCWEVLKRVLAAGRSMPQFVGSTITFVRDQDSLLPPRLITHADMVRGSFEIERAHYSRDKPNVVTMRFRDREGAMRTIDCAAPNVTKARPAIVDSKVIVDRDHAWREGNFMAASNQLRRRYPSWVMMPEGQTLIRGQRIEVSHPRPNWGSPAKIVAQNWPRLYLNAPIKAPPGTQGWLSLARPDGSSWGPVSALVLEDGQTVEIDADDFDAVLAASPQDMHYDQDPRGWLVTQDSLRAPEGGAVALDGHQVEATRVTFGTPGAASTFCKIVEMAPTQGGAVEILAVEDVAAVYLADQKPLPEVISSPAPLVNAQAPSWTGVVISVVTGSVYPDFTISVSGPTVTGAEQYICEIATSQEVGDWGERNVSAVPSFVVATQKAGDFSIRVAVRGAGLLGPWRYFTLTAPAANSYYTNSQDYSGYF